MTTLTMLAFKKVFLNAAHEALYDKARALLDAELARQAADYARKVPLWERLPDDKFKEKLVELRRHHAACRIPYEKALASITALCNYSVIVPAASAAGIVRRLEAR